jgi:hypothetical protein
MLSQGRNIATNEAITENNPITMKNALIQPGIRVPAAILLTKYPVVLSWYKSSTV